MNACPASPGAGAEPADATAPAAARPLAKRVGGLALLLLAACNNVASPSADTERTQNLIRTYGCAACHAIPGVPGADGRTGPDLSTFASRSYVAGVLPNTRDNAIRFVLDPRAVDPRSAMPVLGMTPEEAAILVDYLYGLEEGE